MHGFGRSTGAGGVARALRKRGPWVLALMSGLVGLTVAPLPTRFTSHWVPATAQEWRRMLRRRGCGTASARRDRPTSAACCNGVHSHTNVEQLLLQGAALQALQARGGVLRVLTSIMRGGVLGFVGDSVSSQHYASLVMVARAAKGLGFSTSSISIDGKREYEGVKAATLITPPDGLQRLELRLYRVDKVRDTALEFEAILKKALALSMGSRLWGEPGMVELPRHAVVVNVGLHYAHHDSSRDKRYHALLEALARRMQLFNLIANRVAIFRDTTPQHFRPLSVNRSRSYALRNRSATECAANRLGADSAAWRQLNPTLRLNGILDEVAQKHHLYVQKIAAQLQPRWDAHIEMRRADGRAAKLDCTHWCTAVFDLFDATLVTTLESAFGSN